MSGGGRRWWLVIALLLSVGVNIGIISMILLQRGRAERQASRPVERTLPTFERAAQRLRLEGENRERFVAIHQEFVRSMRRSHRKVAMLRQQMREQLSSRQPDEQRIEEILAQLGEAYAELDRNTAKTVLASRELLNRRQERAYLRILGRLRSAARGEGMRRQQQ